MQQRGIAQEALEFILDYATERHDHHGCRIFFFDKRSRRRAERELGRDRTKRLERWPGCYAVVAGDETIVTVAHRYRRIRRH
jgi:hypothetical protein